MEMDMDMDMEGPEGVTPPLCLASLSPPPPPP